MVLFLKVETIFAANKINPMRLIGDWFVQNKFPNFVWKVSISWFHLYRCTDRHVLYMYSSDKSSKILKNPKTYLSLKMLVSRVCWQHSVHNSIFAESEPPSSAWVCRQVFSSSSWHDIIHTITKIMCPNCYVKHRCRHRHNHHDRHRHPYPLQPCPGAVQWRCEVEATL